MISYETLRHIHLRCQQLKNNNEPFGGLNIILMGDLLQLKPVHGNWIYDQPSCLSHENHLWKMFEMIQLEKNQRQIGDQTYGDLCSRIRLGKLIAQDLDLLNSRLISNIKDKKQFENCIFLAARKKTVADFNSNELAKLKKNQKCFTINAVDTFADGPDTGKIAPRKALYKNEEKCGGLLDSMSIGIGARVMLRRNMDTSKGLVNGSIGTITG
jgi:hypothetical protein